MVDTGNLISLHEKLDDFARHHQRRGVKIAQEVIMQIWNKSLYNLRDGSPEGMKHGEGFDLAFKTILERLEKEFPI